jgi:hypothetical protein
MSDKHHILTLAAKVAIDRVHKDQSVDSETTLSSLEEIRDELEILIEAVQSDIDNQ